MSTPETDKSWEGCSPMDFKGLSILTKMRQLETERDEFRAEVAQLKERLETNLEVFHEMNAEMTLMRIELGASKSKGDK